jgi:hypothetical protein
MRFLAALFLVVAALTSPVLAQLDTANVQRTEAIGCRLGKRTAGKANSLIGRRVVIPALDEAQMAFSEALQRLTIYDLVRSADRLS